jgi:hypothetical protein
MNDAELASYLGIADMPNWRSVIAAMSDKDRAAYDNLRRVEEDIKLWQEGVGPKPTGVILCHDHSGRAEHE